VNRAKPDHPDLFAIVDRLRADPRGQFPTILACRPFLTLEHLTWDPLTSRLLSTATRMTHTLRFPTLA
jgi:hypothetical protein